jgi:hypothetical protein
MTSSNAGGTAGAPENRLGTREFLLVAVVGVLCAVLAFGVASVSLAVQETRYRAEAQLALLPGPLVPPQEIADSWEALNRGQAARIAAEVLGQLRWRAAAAQAAGAPPESITVTAGAVADTSLIDLGVEAGSPQAAEQAADALIREARPVVEQVSGLFVLEVLQPPDGTAARVGTPPGQLLAVTGVAGLLLGGGGALVVIRQRVARRTGQIAPGTGRHDSYPDSHPDDHRPPPPQRRTGPPPPRPANGAALPNRTPHRPGSAPTPPPVPPSTSTPTR